MADKQTQSVPKPTYLDSLSGLHMALNESGYICSPDFVAKVMTSMHTRPVSGAFLYGMAGTGKSYLPMVLAKVLDRQLFVHQCTQGTREEDLLVKIMPSENTISGVKIGHGKIFQAAIESRKRPVMLMLDEWDKTRPSVDGFFLDFLQYGRLSLPGIEDGEIHANLSNLTIFITANDEREFHEALLRRFPMIHVDPIEPADVVSALRLTHDGNKYIPQMIDLYTRSIQAKLPKPATIQELRQMMDAISVLDDSADWNALVYQYITKTPENHTLLSNQDKVEEIDVKRIASVNPDDYGVDIVPERSDTDEPQMPHLRDLATFDDSFEPVQFVPENAVAVLKRDKDYQWAVDDIIMQSNMDNADPELAAMPDWGVITENYAFLTDEINASHVNWIDKTSFFRDNSGEVRVVDKYVTRPELNRMLSGKWHIHKRNSKEIIARNLSRGSEKTDLRYREGKGLEIICSTRDKLTGFFRLNRYTNLANIQAVSDSSCNSLSRIDMGLSTHIAVRNLYKQVVSSSEVLGNSVVKSFSNHSGFCQGIWLKAPNGETSCETSEIPFFEEMKRNTGKYKIHSIPNGFMMTANNFHLAIEDIGDNTHGKMSLLIEGVVHPKVMGCILSWIGVIPLNKCFQHDGTVRERLEKAGWCIHDNNTNVLRKNGICAYIIYDYVIFCTFLHALDVVDEPSLSLDMKTKINRIKALEKAYKPSADEVA